MENTVHIRMCMMLAQVHGLHVYTVHVIHKQTGKGYTHMHLYIVHV